MDFSHVARLEPRRHDLSEQLAAFDKAMEHENASARAERAESLRPTLVDALTALSQLYEDEEVWSAARAAASDHAAQLRREAIGGYPDSLPPLLDLFGYRSPPPPTAHQLVSEAVELLLNPAAEAEQLPPDQEVDAARAALGALLARALPTATSEIAPRDWETLRDASQTVPALEAGVAISLGAAMGAVGVAVTTLAAGAVTGGLGAAAGVLIVGGVRRWRHHRTITSHAKDVAEFDGHLHVALLPAAQGAMLHHLDAVLAASADAEAMVDPLIQLTIVSHLDALMGITRRFALGDHFLATETGRDSLQGQQGPRQLMSRLMRAHAVIQGATAQVLSAGHLDHQQRDALARLRDSIATVDLFQSVKRPRFRLLKDPPPE